jgi:heterodisulfide reductase subunit A-like polyferredoxin
MSLIATSLFLVAFVIQPFYVIAFEGRRRRAMARAEFQTRAYDAIIIGTGQAGPALARKLAGAGMRVAIVERALFGGTCVNTGCIPTKTVIASAYAIHMARGAADFGVVVEGPVR